MSSSLGDVASVRRPSSRPRSERVAVLPSARPLILPLAFSILLVALSVVPGVWHQPVLRWSFWGAGLALLAWNAAMFVAARRHGRTLTIEVSLRKQHYVQACAHLSILTYWGWYWHEVYDAAPLIAGQLVFAYAFDALLAWTRRDTYTFGFGPFPIIFSTNLFLWFKSDWFYFQFLLVAVGFTAKELIRWTKDGRRVHVFNPSSFPLAVASLALLADRNNPHHVGAGNCGDAVQPASHLLADLSGRAAGTVPVRRRIHDPGRGRHDVWVLPDVLPGDWQPLLPRAAVSDCHLSRVAPAVSPIHRRRRAPSWVACYSACSTRRVSSRSTCCSTGSGCRPSTTSFCQCLF